MYAQFQNKDFSLQNNPKNQDLSETDLDCWDCFGRDKKKTYSIIAQDIYKFRVILEGKKLVFFELESVHGEIKTDNLTISDSEIITLDLTVSKIGFL